MRAIALLILATGLFIGTASAQTSYRGVYIGSVVIGGQTTNSVVLLNVLDNNFAVGLVYDYLGRTFLEVPELRIAADGKFTLSALGVQYTGQIQGSGMSAVGTPGNILVVGAKSPASGIAATYAGTYPGWLATPSTTRDHGAVITADGWIFTYARTSATTADGAVGRIAADGTFSLSFVGGDTAFGQAMRNPRAPLLVGSYLRSGFLYNFIGGRENASNDLVNISTRGFVGTGSSVMIAGFIIQPAAKTVYIRAFGPSLAAFGVQDALADPVIELVSGSTTITVNDDWQAGPNAAQIAVRPDRPLHPKDAGLLVTLEPGAYTVILRGKGDGTGNALIEVNQAD